MEDTLKIIKKVLLILLGIVYFIIAIGLIVPFINFFKIYNKLSSLKNETDYSFQKVKYELDRKYSIATSLLKVVREFSKYEDQLVSRVTEIREHTDKAKTIGEKLKMEGYLDNAFSQLKVQIEAYPEIKGNGNYLDLQKQLLETENRLANAKDESGIAIKNFNDLVLSFPIVLYAGFLNFKKLDFNDFGISGHIANKYSDNEVLKNI